MGTNFYWINPNDIEVPTEFFDRWHVGKRSAAGWYCYDCRVPVVRGGDINLVHTSHDVVVDACPKCGQGRPKQDGIPDAALVELGFGKPRQARAAKGVSTCSSFSWAQEPTFAQRICEQRADETIIADEYGRELTGQQFAQMLFANCPIQFTSSIGSDFC